MIAPKVSVTMEERTVKSVERVTETIWPDKHKQPWLARLYWARVNGEMVCVGAEIRSARLPNKRTQRLPAEHSERLRQMATEEEVRRGRVIKGLTESGELVDIAPQEGAGYVVDLKVDGKTVSDMPVAELTPNGLRDLHFGDLLNHVAQFHEELADINADAREAAQREATLWRETREARTRAWGAGRRPISEETALLAAVRAGLKDARDHRLTGSARLACIQRHVEESFPDVERWRAVQDSTLYRWIKEATR